MEEDMAHLMDDIVTAIDNAAKHAYNSGLRKAAEIARQEAGVYTEDGEGDAWIALRIAEAIEGQLK